MPPPTPKMTFMSLASYQGVHTSVNAARKSACATSLLSRGEFLGLPLHRVRVLHQAAPHFLHGSDGGFLGGGWEERTSAILQLPRALGGHDDEPVRALFAIVRN